MILDSNDLGAQSHLECDVCIVGSGAVGITLARELARKRINTICVSGGDATARAQDQDLYRGSVAEPFLHEPLELNRTRAFGGSTLTWGGRLVPFDPIDFEQRPFVPLSGWPIGYEEMARYIPRAAALCELNDCNFEIPVEAAPNDLPAKLGSAIVTNRCERWSMPTDFAQRYAAELRGSEYIRVLLNHHCIDIELNESQSCVERVMVRARGVAPKWISARTFVLAAGGLENPRLLLAARRQAPHGIGNENDMVGRCYMGHVAGTHGSLRLRAPGLAPFYRLHKDKDAMYLRRRFWLTEEAQWNDSLMNIIAFPLRPDPEDPRHGDPLLSLIHLAGRRSRPASCPNDSTAHHLANLLCANPRAWLSAGRQLWQRTRQRPRLPFFLPYHRKNLDPLFFQSEHAPNRESRVVLSEQRDEFGMLRIEPRIAFIEIDIETVVQFFAILDRSLRTLELGHVEYNELALREYLQYVTRNYCSHAHHIGTTRMASDPREGVVDADCCVHGVHNLYIGGSSVFPTSGHANPTITALALTLRMADCLIAEHATAAVTIA